ncbi:hypothetical protein T4E_4324 [Trichinella pseudospiralis]|uniref:Uncharacterized protein n=1 Tax=Trichinella pseudospiralis TaxID=6337 RepID=A0A0V0XMD4_TRIPS|nr:hypothetical protein T4E_4324 [Trichinella pseudospiralis]
MNRKTNHLRQEEAAYEEKTERGEDEEEQLSVDRRETSCRLIGYQRCQGSVNQNAQRTAQLTLSHVQRFNGERSEKHTPSNDHYITVISDSLTMLPSSALVKRTS